MREHWYEEADISEAPVWYNADEARGWAAGWDAAVRAYTDELERNLAAEQRALVPPAARTTDPDTSKASAGSRRLLCITPASPAAALLASFRWGGQQGRTDHEATRSIVGDVTVERFKSIARKCTELRRAGLIIDTGVRRDRAMVCRITGDGMRALSQLRDGMAVYL
jgi:hypothetical protein